MDTNTEQISYNVQQAAIATALTRTAIYEAIATGELRSFKRGRRRLVTAKALQEFVAKLERESAKRGDA